MSKISLKQAAAWCGGTVEEKYADIKFLGANNDTRTLQPGQLFLALQGARDGHDFIPAAMEKGAAAVLCTHSVGDYRPLSWRMCAWPWAISPGRSGSASA